MGQNVASEGKQEGKGPCQVPIVEKKSTRPPQLTFSLHDLPHLPTTLSFGQSLCIGEELLICGGCNNNNCYSYNIPKQQYKWICSYPNETILSAHIVVSYEVNDLTMKGTTLLSFGGRMNRIPYHSLLMNYQSVWNDNLSVCSQQGGSVGAIVNEWRPLPGNMCIGKKEEHNLFGARAIVSGSKKKLLFITRHNDIDVLNLDTFDYLSNMKAYRLPLGFTVSHAPPYHCLVPSDENEFILIREDRSVLVSFNENTQEFTFHPLPLCSHLKSCYGYMCIKVNQYLFILGGRGLASTPNHCTKTIYVYSINERKWSLCDFSLPFMVTNCALVSSDHHSTVHIIGGVDHVHQPLSTHFMLQIKGEHTKKNIQMVVQHWWRKCRIKKIGWIKEFNSIVINFL
ncbi:hypothetical protein RFI_15999 [Reticulomyxa filosa]|uniref:Kelch motif family protein n=1 Tax=Reticulomyxa filosa TaxID=46433 RepID=X6N618_RETFI|nr:hypothetical protein RFI_15999 [Reticulomyxa filosa]|eukprot:ETO21204.1 hypothetical protein RFI_15999 [Reticulomyxa filosa]